MPTLLSVRAEKLTEYVLFCGSFDQLKITDNVSVVYRCLPDSAGFMRFKTSRRLADAFIINNSGGKLHLQVKTEYVNDPELPTVYIYSNFLTKIDSSSEKTIEAHSIAPCPNLSIRQIGNGSISVDGIKAERLKAGITTGAGRITLNGTAQEASYKMVGAGTIMADMLEAQVVKCNVIGAGVISCWAQETLKVKGLGSTRTYYRGNPMVKKGLGLKVYSVADSDEQAKDGVKVSEKQPETMVEGTLEEEEILVEDEQTIEEGSEEEVEPVLEEEIIEE